MTLPHTELGLLILMAWGGLGYLFGSIPSGVLNARFLGLGDLRHIGSGNIGATNVLRTGSKKAAALTLLMDAGKGALAVLLARHFADSAAAQVAALCAILGHCYPIWLRFRGGKAVATLLGILLALYFPIGLTTCLVWLVSAALFKMSSLAALSAALSACLSAYVFEQSQLIVLVIVLNVLIYWRHRGNIARILNGCEPRIGQK